MGWSSGAGLGAEGSGRTSLIETMAYTPGVGLGAEGGKLGDAIEEAARATKSDYKDFAAKSKDKTRERYERTQ
jgi:RNA-binding protein 5/10